MVGLITQRSQVQILPPLPRNQNGSQLIWLPFFVATCREDPRESNPGVATPGLAGCRFPECGVRPSFSRGRPCCFCLALRRVLGWTTFSKETLYLSKDLLPGGPQAGHQVFHARPLDMLRIGVARSMAEGQILPQGFSR